ncbi:MAG: cytochrome b N-terminal domain-containing protein [Gemmatimonadota bacterium]|nr:cytochrome b N-terminal domain-containing protein [Gemmatimonadota bacterium]
MRPLRAADAGATRLFGWRHNPLHQTGALAAALLGLLIITGLYLLVFYRVGAPWQSVARLQADPFLGRWIRSLHRFASDAMVVAVVLHAWRLFAQARSWGPRALAWTSGVVLLAVLFVSGWTGYVMVWDTFGAELAVGGARLFDALPVLSEPVRRIFAGDQSIPSAFFFINLFLHVALPLGAAAGLWIHLSRLARPALLPPRPLLYAVFGALTLLSLAAPSPLAPEASLLAVERDIPVDLFFAFWLPWANALPPWLAWMGAAGTFALAMLVPWLTRRPRTGTWTPSVVDERQCTGCNQCPQDCPWDAVSMVPREQAHGAQSTMVARVNPVRCVSCGVCAGSCAPMGVGPLGHTGRDQVAQVRQAYSNAGARELRPVAICCEHAAPEYLAALRDRDADVRLVPCAGNIHTSALELTLRAGAPGVMVFTCPPRDCRGREGPKWLHERMFNDREAELQVRVNRKRVATAVMAWGDRPAVLDAWTSFAARLKAYDALSLGQLDEPLGALCEPVPLEEPR